MLTWLIMWFVTFLKERLMYLNYVYLWGWRWVVAVVWGMPYGGASFYDFLKGQGYLPEYLPNVSQVVPSSVMWMWVALGILLFIFITFEGSLRYAKKLAKSQVGSTENNRLVELKYAERQKEREEEKQHRGNIYGDIPSLLVHSRETITLAALTVSIGSMQQSKADEIINYVTKKYVEGRETVDFSQEDLWNDIRRHMEVRNIGLNWLEDSYPEVGNMIRALNEKCSNVRNSNLRPLMSRFRDLIKTQSSMEIFARCLKPQYSIDTEAIVLRGKEHWSNELDELQVKINEMIDSLLRLEDLK